MEARRWQKMDRKGSLGVRAGNDPLQSSHNAGGLAFWLIKVERYVLPKACFTNQCESVV
jgi:hypothetical protein